MLPKQTGVNNIHTYSLNVDLVPVKFTRMLEQHWHIFIFWLFSRTHFHSSIAIIGITGGFEMGCLLRNISAHCLLTVPVEWVIHHFAWQPDMIGDNWDGMSFTTMIYYFIWSPPNARFPGVMNENAFFSISKAHCVWCTNDIGMAFI